jgi:hypothetical protein
LPFAVKTAFRVVEHVGSVTDVGLALAVTVELCANKLSADKPAKAMIKR